MLPCFENPGFDALVRLPEGSYRLAQAALLLARDHSPALEVEAGLRRLDGLARRLGPCPALADEEAALGRLRALRCLLCEEFGLRGNAEDYYDPRNSLLDEVLRRGLGIPISLAVVWLDVARQSGPPLVGLGLPGHFMLAPRWRRLRYVIDPFHGGRRVPLDELPDYLAGIVGRPVALPAAALRPVGKREILSRMLRNLLAIHLRGQDWAAATRNLARLMALFPDDENLARQFRELQGRWAALN